MVTYVILCVLCEREGFCLPLPILIGLESKIESKIKQAKDKSLFKHNPLNQSITLLKVKVKWSRYRPGVAQRVGRGIAVLFHDRGTRRGWVVSSTPRPHFTPGKDPVPIVQEAGWAPQPVWTSGKSRPHWDSNPDRPARSQSLYRLSYPAHGVAQRVPGIKVPRFHDKCTGW